MTPIPPNTPSPAPAASPSAVLDAFQRYRDKGGAGAVEQVVIAAVLDYRPSANGAPLPLTDQTRLLEDLSYDSVSVAELIFFLEDLFDLTIANEDIMDVRTIGDLRACVIRKLADRSGTA